MNRHIRSTADLAAAIRRRRREKNWTQQELGDHAGLAAKHISRVETGTHEPKISTMLAILAALGLDLYLEDRSAREAASPRIEDIF